MNGELSVTKVAAYGQHPVELNYGQTNSFVSIVLNYTVLMTAGL